MTKSILLGSLMVAEKKYCRNGNKHFVDLKLMGFIMDPKETLSADAFSATYTVNN